MARPDPRSPLLVNLLLAVASLVVSALGIALLEGALRVLDVGPPASPRLAFQQVELPALEPAERADGTPVWRTRDPRHPLQSLPERPGPAHLRVFAFGASATAGLGFSPNAAFARALERMLQRAEPGRHPEVVNLGLVGIASRQVRQLVDDVCLRYAPDTLVVYAGNNEFLELHAEKYAEAHGTLASRALDLLLRTRLYGTTRQLLGRRTKDPSLAERGLSREDFELDRDAVVRDLELTPAERAAVVDGYEANLDAIARTAAARAVPLVLMTVGSNWRWLGREDLSPGWIEELLGDAGEVGAPAGRERLLRADRVLAERLAASAPAERSGWLFRRAAVAEALGDPDAARALYRAAVNEDPHLRRALDVMNERVAAVAARHGAILVDTVGALAERAPDGILGFDTFFDHVHFTPRGAELAAAAIFDALARAGVVALPEGFDAAAHLEARLAWLDALARDPLDATEWLGLGFDPQRQIRDRDLWKYDRLVQDLDARVDDPTDRLHALVYRGNAASFRQGGSADAERDYRAALETGDDPAIRRNLERILARAPH